MFHTTRVSVLIGLVVLAVLALWGIFLQSRSGERVAAIPQAPATWTPTPQNVPAFFSPLSPLPTPVPTFTPLSLPTSPPTVSPTQTPPSSTPTPTLPPATPTPQKIVKGRIDEIGPLPLPTVEPLPFGQGIQPIRLLIPVLDLDAPIEEMGWKTVTDAEGTRTEWEVVDFAAGHHINSAYPGEAGNVVLSGHNNIGGSIFRSVCVIGEPGVDFGLEDELILVDKLGQRFTYQINGWRRIAEANASIARRLENAQWLEPTENAQLTLVTCWPPWSNTHRVIITGLLTAMELN